ncbi:MAG TPA: type VI secretion system tube protein Hcp [Humisphaera sp.]|jgi:type VI protein secretion system component Hcp|nr:type VI secretion system tube protein Hcp [Humisphaera sp.]
MLLSAAPSATLELKNTAAGAPSITLQLNSYQFGIENAATIGSVGGAGAGKAKLADLHVTTPMSEASPLLLSTVVNGAHFDSAVLTQLDANGNEVAHWSMNTVFVDTDTIQDSSARVPSEALNLQFGALTESIPGEGDGSTSGGDASASEPSVPASPVTLELQSSDPTLPSITIGLNSYNFGIENPITIGSATTGAGAGKIKFDDLSVATAFSGASPKLFAAVAQGSHFDTAVLTQRNAAGDPVAQWILGTVILTADNISGGNSSPAPAEALTAVFGSVRELTAGQNPPPSTQTFAPLPAPGNGAMKLELHPSDSTLPAVTLGLNSYQFGFANPVTVGTGAGTGNATFDELLLSTTLSDASPQLFRGVASGGFDSAVLTQTNAAGIPMAQWVLGGIFLTSDAISGGGVAVPTEQVHVAFGSVRESTAQQTAFWNQVLHDNEAPGATGDSLAPLPPTAAPAVTLELQPSDATLPSLTLNLDSYSFGLDNPQTIGSASGGAGAGKVNLRDLIVSTRLSDASPQMLDALVVGGHYQKAVLTQRNAAGDPEAVWNFGLVFVTSDVVNSDALLPSAAPVEQLHMAFGSLSQVLSDQSEVPPGNGLVPLPPAPATGLTLELQPPDSGPTGESFANTITIALDNYRFGFQNTGSLDVTGGQGAGKAKFDELAVAAALSAESSPLLSAAAAGSHFKTATLTQRDAAGNAIAQWVLGTVVVSSDLLNSNALDPAAVPTETLGLAFASVTESTAGHTASWDQTTNTRVDPLPSTDPLSPLPTVAPPAITLDLHPSDSSLPDVILGLNSYQFSFENSASIGSQSGGSGAGKAKLNDLIVALPLNDASPQLFKALVNGTRYDTVVLTQRNAAGQPVAEWVLGPVVLSSDGILSNGTLVPTETLQMAFGAITERTADFTKSWNQLLNTNGGPAPTGITLAPLGAVAPAVSVTDNGGIYNGTPQGVTAATAKAGSTTLATLGSPSLSFTYYIGSLPAGTGSATAPTNAGTYTVVAHFSTTDATLFADANSAPVVFTISPAPLTITANNQTKIAGEANPAFSVGYSGFVPGQGPAVLGGALTFSTPATSSSPAGLYAITPGGLTSSNYAIKFVSGTLTVISPSQAASNLLAQVNAASIPPNDSSSFASQIQAALDSLNRGKTGPAINQLSAFINHVNAQKGKSLSAATANALIAAAQRLINALS